MKIVAFRAENFKRLKLVELHPDGSVVRLTGRNDQGKTSCLDAISAVLGGEKLCPAVPIRVGQEFAEVTADLGDLIATRRWTKSGSTLTVKNREGFRAPSPQKKLDEIIGKLSFDPLAFSRAPAAEQVEILRKLVGVDFSLQDSRRAQLYDQRTQVNREVAALKGAVARMPEVEAPDEPVSVTALLAEQDRLLAEDRRAAELVRASDAATLQRQEAMRLVEARKKQVADLEAQLARARESLALAEKHLVNAERAEDAAGAACIERPDLTGIREQLAAAEGTNARVRAKKARAAEIERLAAKQAEADALTAKIAEIDQAKADALAATKFPIEGLGFGDGCVTLNGLPFSQSGGAGKLRASLAIGIAINKGVRVMMIDEASVLDAQSLAIVEEMAAAADTQVWMTMPGEGGPGQIVIEDGEVAHVG